MWGAPESGSDVQTCELHLGRNALFLPAPGPSPQVSAYKINFSVSILFLPPKTHPAVYREMETTPTSKLIWLHLIQSSFLEYDFSVIISPKIAFHTAFIFMILSRDSYVAHSKTVWWVSTDSEVPRPEGSNPHNEPQVGTPFSEVKNPHSCHCPCF